jgi:hypothetical protein
MKIAFIPAVSKHAARFVGRTPAEVSRDAELLSTVDFTAARAAQPTRR